MSAAIPLYRTDTEAAQAHLSRLFSPIPYFYAAGLLEIRAIIPNRGGAHSATFACDEAGRAAAVAWAALENEAGRNVYVGLNPRRAAAAGRAGTDADIEIAFAHLVDLDAGADTRERLAAGRLPPCFRVVTGTAPYTRLHAGWLLDQPTRDLAGWTARQKALAQWFAGDATIHNPSRIVRLAGTVAYPDTGKAGRGYRVERTAFEAVAETDDGVSAEAIAAAYSGPGPFAAQPPPGAGAGAGASGASGTGAVAGWDIPGRGSDPDALMARIRAGDHWNECMLRLVAHWIGRGWRDSEILAAAHSFTLAGYTHDQTIAEVQSAITRGRRKWGKEQPEHSAEEAPADAAETYPTLSINELLALPPPEWLLEGILEVETEAVLYGPPASLKSFLALAWSLCIAAGIPWLGRPVRQVGVLYVAGEGVRGLGKRIRAWQRHHGLEGAALPFRLLPQAVNLTDPQQTAKLIRTAIAAAEAEGVRIGLVVIDTVARAMVGADENSAQEMGRFVEAMAIIRREVVATLLGIHHAGKDAAKGARGSTALKGGVDTEICVVRDENDKSRLTVKVEKQKNADEGEPIRLRTHDVAIGAGIVPETSLVLLAAEDDGRSDQAPLGGQMGIAHRALIDALAGEGRHVSDHRVPPDVPCVPIESWRAAFYATRAGDDSDARKKAFQRVRDDLLKRRRIGVADPFVWVV